MRADNGGHGVLGNKHVSRIYLFVPPEENADVQALSAQRDTASKRWYIGPEDTPTKFSRWLPSSEGDEEFTIISDRACVAAAQIACRQCGAGIEVICIHCESGISEDEPLTHFTVSDVCAMDEALADQLRRWPTFRRISTSSGELGNFANHCSNCGAAQDDLYLHSEPGDAFFDIPHAAPGAIKFTPLAGTVCLNGGEHFIVD